MNEHRAVFMGTPAFAVASLDALVKAGIDIAAVVTAPDKPAGRGQQLRMSAVKEYALTQPHLAGRVLQPTKLKDPTFLAQLDAAQADLYIVVAFRMLPETVWTRPRFGTFNLHGSLLPQYRGAAPINWAVMNGETRTGVTTFLLRQEIDTGDVLHREEVDIGPDETASELHDRLMVVGAELVVRTAHDLFLGQVAAHAQDNMPSRLLRTAPKLTPENCRIDWSREPRAVHDHIRGLSAFPGAWSQLRIGDRSPQHFKILRSRLTPEEVNDVPGTVLTDNDRFIVQCAGGVIEATEVQAEGKRRMDAAAFLRGLHGTPHLRFVQ